MIEIIQAECCAAIDRSIDSCREASMDVDKAVMSINNATDKASKQDEDSAEGDSVSMLRCIVRPRKPTS